MSGLILVSASPRRAELLKQLGICFERQITDVDEKRVENEEPDIYVRRVSRLKVLSGEKFLGKEKLDSNPVLLGADTVVTLEGVPMGKPGAREEAIDMLMSLSGRTHSVVTGVVLKRKEKIIEDSVETLVTFRKLTRTEAQMYCDTGEPMDKAGAYGIQGKAAVFVAGIRGSYSNVVGLPLFELSIMLKEFGIDCLDNNRSGK